MPECHFDGRYKQEQCHTATGYCWCVDKHGHEVPRTRVSGRSKPKCDGVGRWLTFTDSLH